MIVKVINKSSNELPKYETPLSAGTDVRADFSRVTPENLPKTFGNCQFEYSSNKKALRMSPGSRALIPTGVFSGIPEGYEVQLRPRSGLAIKKGITLINCLGTIDADYRNEWGIPIINLGLEDVWIEDGERICQAVLNKVEKIEWEEVTTLDSTERNGGFGSTNYDENGNYKP